MENLTQQIAEQLGLDLRGLPLDSKGLYEQDASIWAHVQAEAIKRGDFAEVDWPKVIEEIESVGRMERSTWNSQCRDVLLHMLRIQHAPPQSRGFRVREEKIRKARKEMSLAVWNHPGMTGPVLDVLFADAWHDGKQQAILDLLFDECHRSGLQGREREALRKQYKRELEELIPDQCPWSIVEVAGCNPRDEGSHSLPCEEVWPAPVAKRLNQELTRDYPTHGWVAGGPENPIVPRDEL